MHSKKLWVNRNEISQIRLYAVAGVSAPSQHRQAILMDVNVKKRENWICCLLFSPRAIAQKILQYLNIRKNAQSRLRCYKNSLYLLFKPWEIVRLAPHPHSTMNSHHHPMSFPKCAKYTKPKITRVKSLFWEVYTTRSQDLSKAESTCFKVNIQVND